MRQGLLACLTAGLSLSLPAPGSAAPRLGACDLLAEIPFASAPPFAAQSLRFRADAAVTLSGCLYRPQGSARFPVLVMVAGSGDAPFAADVYTRLHARALAQRGIAVFAFDKRGVGSSEGAPTGTDFKQRADDVAAALRFVRALPMTSRIAVWGVSQAGWVIPQALRKNDGVEFVILVSPAGVNPYDQMAYYFRNLASRLGCTQEQAAAVERLYRAVVRYYATGKGYEAARRQLDIVKGQPWFEQLRASAEWNESTDLGGRLLAPAELARAWKERLKPFAFYRAPSVFADYRPVYEALDRPTLIVHGADDTVVPVADSHATFAAAFARNRNRAVQFKVFAGAEHGLPDGPGARPDYLDFIAGWARERFLSPKAPRLAPVN
jgi:hypothetical protein